MNVPIIDIFILILACITSFKGFKQGFIRSSGGFIAQMFGIYIAIRYYVPLSLWFFEHFGWSKPVGMFVGGIILFVITSRILGLLVKFLHKTYGMIAVLPFMKLINRVAGAMFGIVKVVVVMGLFLAYLVTYNYTVNLEPYYSNSQMVLYLEDVGLYLFPLAPLAVEKVEQSVDQVEDAISSVTK